MVCDLEVNGSLLRTICRDEDGIKINTKQRDCGDVEWTHLAQVMDQYPALAIHLLSA